MAPDGLPGLMDRGIFWLQLVWLSAVKRKSNLGAVLIVEVSHVPGALCTLSQAVSSPGTDGTSKL